MKVRCLTSDVVLFLIVALKTLNISQGSVATHLRYGGIYSDNIITIFSWFWQWNNCENRLIFDKYWLTYWLSDYFVFLFVIFVLCISCVLTTFY